MEPLVVPVVVLGAAALVDKAVVLVRAARARVVERRGRPHRTLGPGLHVVVPFLDRVRPVIDLREQVVSLLSEPVLTAENLVVAVDTVLHVQVTDPRVAAAETADPFHAVERLTVTTLRAVVGSMPLEQALASRAQLARQLRSTLSASTGRWGVRVNRVDVTAVARPTGRRPARVQESAG